VVAGAAAGYSVLSSDGVSCWRQVRVLTSGAAAGTAVLTTNVSSRNSLAAHLFTVSGSVHKLPRGRPTKLLASTPKQSAVLRSAYSTMPLGVVQNLTTLLPPSWVSRCVWRMTPTKSESLPQPDSLAIEREMGKSERSYSSTGQLVKAVNAEERTGMEQKKHGKCRPSYC
jgi:hypothetical protein